jgi:Arc/MetJ family transcription regulator
MKTSLTLPDDLLNEALSLTGLSNKREAVVLALQTLVQIKRQERIRQYRGKLNWEGKLDEMRSDK